MHRWHDDVVRELAASLLALPDDHPAVVALPQNAAEARAWLLREHAAEMELEAARRARPAPDYRYSIEIDRAAIDKMIASEPWQRVFPPSGA